MRKIRSVLIMVLLAILVIKLLWITVEPMLPYALIAVVLVTIVGFVFRRATRL